MKTGFWRAFARVFLLITVSGLAACEDTGGNSISDGQVFAPGIDLDAEKNEEGADALEVGHRLIAAGEYDLAIDAFNRAALERGELNAEILSGYGTANLGLGRLRQAEKLMRRAVEEDDAQPVDYNNLGVVPVSYTHLTLPTNRVACRYRW